MRISLKPGLLVLTCCAAVLAVSCLTTQTAERANVASPAEKAPSPKPPKKAEYTRIAFAERLETLLSEGKTDEAIALFDTVPEPDRSDFGIRMLKLSILISANRKDESAALANELEAIQPQNAELLYIQAVLAGSRNDANGRTAYLNKVLKIQPDHSQAMTALGLDLYSRKNYAQAKTWLVKAVAADPDNADALLALARVYYMQDELPKAGDTLNLAVDKDPTYSVIWAERARVRAETNDLPGALADIAKAVELDPLVYSHWIDYGNYLISSLKKKEAREAFSRAIRIDPEQYLAYIYRAGINDDLGDTEAAIADYTAICRLFPQYYYAAESLGILLWGKGDYAGSRAAFVQALEYNTKNVSYALMVTLCYYREKNDAAAKNFMAKYITTLDRNTTEYFLCRLFVDRSGDADVMNRIVKEKNINDRNRMLFYAAEYYDLFQNKDVAQKYYLEVISVPAPTFFEYRLSKWAFRNPEPAAADSAKG